MTSVRHIIAAACASPSSSPSPTNGVIGRDNKLPWHLSTDLKRFKALTMGHHVDHGAEDVRRDRTQAAAGTAATSSSAVSPIAAAGERRAGGDSIERRSPRFRRSEDEVVHPRRRGDLPADACIAPTACTSRRFTPTSRGDTYFPEFDDVNEWRLADREDFEADAKNDYPYSFLTYDRIASTEHPIAEEG